MGGTISERLNNPVCIKGDPRDPWRGSDGLDERGHAKFVASRWCVRAWLKTLLEKERNRKVTLRRLIRDYAPADDTVGSIPGAAPNRPDYYAEAVGQWIGRDPDAEWDIFDDRTGAIHSEAVPLLVAIWRAIERMESGGTVCTPMSELLAGAGEFYADYVEKRARNGET